MKRALVTGGAGYIGSHAAKAFAVHGYEPVVLDDLSMGHRWAIRWGPLVQGDISDAELVRRTVARYKISAAIHFAATAYVGESMGAPGKYFHNNVANSIAMLNALIGSGVRQVVFSSTCATYGVPRCVPLDEDHPQSPINPYGESKLFIERALAWYGKAHGLRSVVLRYFNAAGADRDCEIGEDHDPETHLIPLAVFAAQGSYPPLRIFGVDYDTPDGTAIRDYVHVSDLAEAHVGALQYLERGGESTAINLGMGRGRSVREIQRAVEKVAGRSVPVIVCSRREGDPPILVASAEKARKLLNWSPRSLDIEEIIETAWRWHTRAPRRLAAGASGGMRQTAL